MNLNISSGKVSRAIKTVIYGTEGIGKSTLAAQFPGPLFIDVEGGTAQMDVRRIEAPRDWTELVSIVNEVSRNPGICGTLILDTADFSEQMLIGWICKKYKKTGIEDFGYGKGYTYLMEEWQQLMAAFDAVIKAGMNVTVIAHARQRKIELPDQAGAFDHWEMKLTRQVAPLLKEWADLLLFCNYKTYVVTTDNDTKKAQGGKRVMYTSHSPVYDAKNRHGLPEELPLSFEGLQKIFEQQGDSTAAAATVGTAGLDLLKQLHELMEDAGITDYQVRAVVSEKGHYPIDTPISEYSEKFLKNFCIKYFDKIADKVREGEE